MTYLELASMLKCKIKRCPVLNSDSKTSLGKLEKGSKLVSNSTLRIRNCSTEPLLSFQVLFKT